MKRADPNGCQARVLTLSAASATFDRRHRQPFRSKLLVIELRLFKGAAPDLCAAFTINFSGKCPGAIGVHARDDLAETLNNMFNGVDVVVQDDHTSLWISLGCALSFENGCCTGR